MAWSTPGKYLSFALRVSSNPFMNRLIIIHTVDQLISITYQVFKLEPFLLAVVVFYGAFFWFGSKINRTKANTWFVFRFFVFTFVPRGLRVLVHASRAKKTDMHNPTG
jgi:hypothetical protein